MTSLGKKTAPHWFLPVPEVSQSAAQPSPYFPIKKLPGKLGAPRCPPPGVGGGQWRADAHTFDRSGGCRDPSGLGVG